MASPNPPCLMIKFFLGSFSIAIIGLALAVSCEAKHFETIFQSSLNQNSYHDHHSLNTPTLDSISDFVVPLYDHLIQDSINAISKLCEDFSENGALSREIKSTTGDLQSAISSCRELLSLSSYTLNTSRTDPTRKTLATFKIDLCSTLTYIDTCSDELMKAPEKARNIVISSLNNSKEKVSNILSMLPSVDEEHDDNLDSIDGGSSSGNAWPPSWMSSEEEGILFHMKRMRIDVVVAKDGSGRFKTISEAINAAPNFNRRAFVIYVKAGRYDEYVNIEEKKWKILIFGDGMYKTVVSGNRSDRTKDSIFSGATFAVRGRGFIAMNMGFENTAGPTGGRGVAFLSASDQSVYYKCSMSGYQDTLFAASGRQFYRECVVSGSVDFIFGAASAVFQKSTILVRKTGDVNWITAHSRDCPNCPGGYSFQDCWVRAAENLGGARTFLGRPWKPYAIVVFMQSDLDSSIDPKGWTPMEGSTIPRTAFFGEYMNRGRGSWTGRRASGVKRSLLNSQARGFTVTKLLDGARWVPASGIPYRLSL